MWGALGRRAPAAAGAPRPLSESAALAHEAGWRAAPRSPDEGGSALAAVKAELRALEGEWRRRSSGTAPAGLRARSFNSSPPQHGGASADGHLAGQCRHRGEVRAPHPALGHRARCRGPQGCHGPHLPGAGGKPTLGGCQPRLGLRRAFGAPPHQRAPQRRCGGAGLRRQAPALRRRGHPLRGGAGRPSEPGGGGGVPGAAGVAHCSCNERAR